MKAPPRFSQCLGRRHLRREQVIREDSHQGGTDEAQAEVQGVVMPGQNQPESEQDEKDREAASDGPHACLSWLSPPLPIRTHAATILYPVARPARGFAAPCPGHPVRHTDSVTAEPNGTPGRGHLREHSRLGEFQLRVLREQLLF